MADRREPAAVTTALDVLADELDGNLDDWSTEASRQALEGAEW